MNISNHPDTDTAVTVLLSKTLSWWVCMFDQHRKVQTEGQCVNVTQSLCRAHLTDPCWRWYCGLAGGWVRGRWFGALPWHFLPRRPTMAPSGPGQMLSSPLWRYWCKSTCQRPPWCGRDQGSAGCWWCPICVLRSSILHTCSRRDKVSSEPCRSVCVLISWLFHIMTYFLWAWKEAKVKLLPWYSPKNLLSSRRMWCTSLAEQRR